jgi:ATP-dependent DNA helicase RecG
MLTLDIDITKISRVGQATAKKLKKLGIEIARDLLFYFPFRYDDFSKITPINKLEPGTSANIVGRIELIQNKRSHRRRMHITESLVSDESGTAKVIWFNQPFIAKVLRVGDRVSFAGRVEDDFGGAVMMAPVYEKINFTSSLSTGQAGFVRRGDNIHTQGLVPNYHLTANLTHKQIRFLIKQVIGLAKEIKDWLPEETKKNLKLLSATDALVKIHFPKNKKDIEEAKSRLSFDELFLIQLRSQLLRRDAINRVSIAVKFFEKETKKFVDSLPFKLTNSQRKSAWEIIKDIGKEQPMTRLLEGDVGSGKTVVACIALLNAALNKKQAVLMVPTEILARQHYESVCRLFADFDIRIGLVTRSDKRLNYESPARNALTCEAGGGIMNNGLENKKNKLHNSLYIIHNSQIIIGTHALIQENIEFNNLALVVIDEQHRFGVEQRKMLIDKSGNKKITTHLLSMTATPIPRSLALVLYGDLDISIINEMPVGRKKIFTKIVLEENREKAYNFIREEIKKGRQVFVICPLIDLSGPLRLSESEASKLGVKSVKEEFKKLDENIFPEIKMAMLHGRMKGKEKEEIMRKFLASEIKILVSTSVVEVGVDVPNASVMMIEGADRFGLAQLHQFRGRVGRSDFQSYCFLFTESDSDNTLKRLDALTKYNDGFVLARMDLKFRGPGEVYGTMQKGFPELKIASLFDYELMKKAKEEAEKLIKKDASLNNWPELKEKITLLNFSNYLTG